MRQLIFRLSFLYIAASLLFLTGCSTKKVDPPKAQQGVLDLTSWTFSDNGSVNLNGQ